MNTRLIALLVGMALSHGALAQQRSTPTPDAPASPGHGHARRCTLAATACR